MLREAPGFGFVCMRLQRGLPTLKVFGLFLLDCVLAEPDSPGAYSDCLTLILPDLIPLLKSLAGVAEMLKCSQARKACWLTS